MGAEAMPIARPRASRGLVVTSQGMASDVLPDMIDPYHNISAAVSGSLQVRSGWLQPSIPQASPIVNEPEYG
jgi:hypothetical protein